LEHDDVLVRDQMQRESGVALLADEVALEEAAARDEVGRRDAGEQRDASLDRDQTGGDAARAQVTVIFIFDQFLGSDPECEVKWTM
jgi:hypothetical protein